MQILIAPDKFKGSLSALEAGQAMARGIQQVLPEAQLLIHPLADGGEGSLAILQAPLQLAAIPLKTSDPLGRPIQSSYYYAAKTAFIELATSSGLQRLVKREYNPLQTTTLGTGQLVVDAIQKGFRQIYLFLGGSSSNDAGMGIAQALGYRFLDASGQVLPPCGASLAQIHQIDDAGLMDLSAVQFTLLCDVKNPLYGKQGAAWVYARQKGASDAAIEYLDQGLRQFAQVVRVWKGMDLQAIEGGGAAGGIAAGLVGLLGAQIESGIDSIMALTNFEKQVQVADWVMSGEGKIDHQSLEGKVIEGVARLCQQHQKPLFLLCGKNDLTDADLQALGITGIRSIMDHAPSLKVGMEEAGDYLAKAAVALVEKKLI
ncbi:MAG: glycerate kinase [Bacteroidota bacterium]